jgi:hypothetical protein
MKGGQSPLHALTINRMMKGDESPLHALTINRMRYLSNQIIKNSNKDKSHLVKSVKVMLTPCYSTF